MMNSFKKSKSVKRVANVKKQKLIDIKKKNTEELKKPVSDTSDSESDSDSDSEYEEILISSLTASKKKADPKPDHSNHFQDEPEVARESATSQQGSQRLLTHQPIPIPIPKPKKSKSKKVVIKKYYQQKIPKESAPPETPKIKPQPTPPKPRQSYIGIGDYGVSDAKFNNKLSSRILNW